MSRVDELQKKYPSIPRQILAKAEALTHGIRDSDLLYKHSYWNRSGVGAHQTRDHDTSLKELADKRPAVAAKAGYVKRPEPFYLKGGWGVMIMRDSTSPYEIREPEPGKYALLRAKRR